jgi:hypothetical protein
MVSGSNSSLNFLVDPPEGFVEGAPPNSQLGVPVFIYIVKRTSSAVYGEITALSALTLFIPGTTTTVALVVLKLPFSTTIFT